MNEEELKLAKIDQNDMSFVIMNKPFEELKPYFTDSHITKNPIYSDIQYNLNHALYIACNNYKFHIIKYVLTSPEISLHADIHYNNDCVIHAATSNGGYHIVEYLLTSPELKEHINIYNSINEVFENMLLELYKEYNDMYHYGKETYIDQDIVDTLNYLIYDFNISPTPKVIDLLIEKSPKDIYEPAIKQLTSNLLYNSINKKIEKNGSFKDKKINKKKI